MTLYQFKVAIEPAEKMYGVNNYPTVRTELLYEIVKNCDGDKFAKYVRNHIANSSRPIIGEHLKEFAVSENHGRPFKYEPAPVVIACEFCSDFGVVIATPKSMTGRQTLLNHDCEAGRQSQFKLPIADERLLKIYNIEKVYDSWFKPEMVADGIWESILEKTKSWTRRVRFEEAFWETRSDVQI